MVVGAGFIGAEVAAVCRARGLEVTVLEAAEAPLERALGAEMGMVMAGLHRDHGVDLRLGVGVDGFEGTDRVEAVRLSDGSRIEASVVLVGIGVAPNTGWVEGSGLNVEDGIVTDDTLAAAPGVVAAGDIARWPSARYGELLRVEHWETAIQMGEAAARRLLADHDETEPARFDPVPWFWSDQYDVKIQLAGRSGAGDDVEVVIGSTDERRFVALYGRAGRVVGVLGMNRPRHVMQLRALVTEPTAWADGLARARELAMSEQSPADELVDHLADDGSVIGSVTRRTMRQGNLLHGAVFIAVVNDRHELAVHRRAAWKDLWASWWDLAFGGVLGAGEAWDDAARREMEEETGSRAALVHLGESSYADGKVREIAHVYLARDNGPFTFPDGEVAELAWVPLDQLRAWIARRQVCPDSVAIVVPLLEALDP